MAGAKKGLISSPSNTMSLGKKGGSSKAGSKPAGSKAGSMRYGSKRGR